MTKLLDYLAEPETVVVLDIDGVLAVYEFGDLRHSACPDEDWETYVRTRDPYATSRPVRQIQGFVAAKGPERCYACSVAADYEAPGKRDFVTANYGIPANHVHFSPNKASKLEFLEELAASLGLPRERVALVEDTVGTLDLAMERGFCSVHVSSFFAWGED